MEEVVIVGAGISGLATALGLHLLPKLRMMGAERIISPLLHGSSLEKLPYGTSLPERISKARSGSEDRKFAAAAVVEFSNPVNSNMPKRRSDTREIEFSLYEKGIRTLVLESSDSLRASGFALTIWANGWKALDALGVADSLRQTHLALQRIVANSASSGGMTAQIPFSAQGKRGELEVRCLRRNLLLEALAKELPPGTIRYCSKVIGIEEDGYLKLLHLADGSSVKTKVLLGCDGVNSVVSKWLGLSKPTFSKRLATRGFVVLPEGHGFKHEFLQYSGEGFRSGFLTCDERSIYWFFTRTPTDHDKEAEENASKMKQLILSKMRKSKLPEKVIDVIEKSEMSEPVSSPLRYRWPFDVLIGNISKGNVSVAGDALHPMTPDIGQGGCSALEDAIVLARTLGEAIIAGKRCKTEGDEYMIIENSLEKYAKERRWRSFDLISTAYFVGLMQQNEGAFLRFLRDKCLAGILARLLLKKAEFDCGKI